MLAIANQLQKKMTFFSYLTEIESQSQIIRRN